MNVYYLDEDSKVVCAFKPEEYYHQNGLVTVKTQYNIVTFPVHRFLKTEIILEGKQ